MSYINLKMYRKAVEDCQAGIRLDATFARVYKRLFMAYLALGEVVQAKEALDHAVQLNASDPTNVKDKDVINTVIH